VAPADVAEQAHRAGLAAIALTDHDSTAGVSACTHAAAAWGVRVVAGCEFSVKAPWGELHVLGYFLPVDDARLESFLTATRAQRQRRGDLMVEKLQRLGVAIAAGDVAAQVRGGALGRPHVARALVEQGAVSDLEEAFTRYLGRGRPAYVEKPLPTLAQVAELVHAVGGLTVAAHLGDRGSEGQLRQFKEQGLDGLEVRHPSHDASTEARLTRIAERLGLGVSGGSDWHGDTETGGTHAPLGGIDVPLEWLERLEARRT
jgi:predicted metal-dependent phosphoesterase TrpH